MMLVRVPVVASSSAAWATVASVIEPPTVVRSLTQRSVRVGVEVEVTDSHAAQPAGRAVVAAESGFESDSGGDDGGGAGWASAVAAGDGLQEREHAPVFGMGAGGYSLGGFVVQDGRDVVCRG